MLKDFLTRSRSAPTKYTIGYISLHMMMGVQLTLLQEGHTLRLWWPNSDLTDAMGIKALFPEQVIICTTPEEAVTGADFWFCDYMNKADVDEFELIDRNPFYVCNSELSDILETNREFGKQVANFWCNLTVPPNGQQFATQENLEQYINTELQANRQQALALKGLHNTALVHDLHEALAITGSYFNTTDWPVFIEQLLPKQNSLELAFGAFFNGKEYFNYALLTHEYKGCNNGDRGSVLTSEVGTALAWVTWDLLPQQIQNAFTQLVPALKSSGYRGFIDFNTIITTDLEKDRAVLNFLEFTCRPGYPTEFEVAAFWTHSRQYGEWLAALAGLTYWPKITYRDEKYIVGLGAALFATGNGLDFDPKMYKLELPLLNMPEQWPSCISFMPCDLKYCPEKDQLLTTDWDRALFLVHWMHPNVDCIYYDFDSLLQKNPVLYPLLEKLRIWGHTYRDDIGSDLSINQWLEVFRTLDKTVPALKQENLSVVVQKTLERKDISWLYWLEHNAGFSSKEVYDIGEFIDRADQEEKLLLYYISNNDVKVAYALVRTPIDSNSEPTWCNDSAILNSVANNCYYLDNMVVHPQYQGKGLGRFLIKNIAKDLILGSSNNYLRLHCQSRVVPFYLDLTPETAFNSKVYHSIEEPKRCEIYLFINNLVKGDKMVLDSRLITQIPKTNSKEIQQLYDVLAKQPIRTQPLEHDLPADIVEKDPGRVCSSCMHSPCCTIESAIMLSQHDIDRLAHHLGLSVSEFPAIKEGVNWLRATVNDHFRPIGAPGHKNSVPLDVLRDQIRKKYALYAPRPEISDGSNVA